MAVESGSELTPVQSEGEPRKPWRQKLVKGTTALGIAVITAIASSATTVGVTKLLTPSSPSKDAAVTEVLRVDSLKSNEANVIEAKEFGVGISGDLLSDLPSGKQVFAAVRGKWNEQDAGSIRNGTLSFAQCSIDPTVETFDCGTPWLGKPGDIQDYYVYVGIADQNAAGSIIDALEEQAKSNDAKNWSHSAPAGFDPLSPIVVRRQ